ncbi:MAG TPA: GGDEF domain-containing protein [Terracidiphilus sp.]|nr:GGDEF domain-containing protein [Terracidiphilus sp.]
MLNRRLSLAVLLGSVFLLEAVSICAQRAPLTSLAAVHAISNTKAAQSLPVDFEASVTYYEEGNVDLFVQDRGTAIYVETAPDLRIAAGDRVLVQGITRASFRPEILATKVTFLRHGLPPAPVDTDFAQLIRGQMDCRRVKVRASVLAANVATDGPRKSVLLDLLMPGGPFQAQIANGGIPSNLQSLLDSTVEITGAVAGKFDSKMQMTGILLEVASYSDLRIVKPAQVQPQKIAPRPFDEILQELHVDDKTERVRVEGTVTYDQPGAAMVLQNGENTLWVDTLSEQPYRVGDHVFVSGFPQVRNGSVVLTRAAIENTISSVPLNVAQVDPTELASGSHAFELVSVDGRLIMSVREAAQDQYVIAAQGHVFSAIYRHPERGLNLPISPMRDLRLGSRVRVTGICVLDRGDQFRGPVAFHLLLRSSQDLALLGGPSPISVRNLVIVLGFLLVVVFLVIGRALLLERKLRRQALSSAATAERWRTRVIDGINRAIPMRDTLLQVTEMLAFQLQSEFCWAEIEMEGTFGNCPDTSERGKLEIIEKVIPAHSGAELGKICVGLRPGSAKRSIESEVLENAVRLVALAIETGGKYSDLVRRSELDPLTNARNRFAFDRALDLAVGKGKQSGANFGLIYVDLDRFKQVNDQFGHQVGDRYLQETVNRLGAQLRSTDLLARMGGDEFAVLVTDVSGRAEVDDIAQRLQTCFDTPFRLGNVLIPPSASIGVAVFPEDATTQSALLECADIRMYKVKGEKRRQPARPRIVTGTDSAKNERWGT